jgi:hypothetical protein
LDPGDQGNLRVLLGLIGCWLVLNVLVGAYLLHAGRPSQRPGSLDLRREGTIAVLTAGLIAALAATAAVAPHDVWRPVSLLGVLLSFALASDALPVATSIFRISGSFLAIVLAAALLGAAPAVTIGVACTLVDAIRRRSRPLNLLVNLVAFTAVPLATGAALHQLAPSVPEGVFAAAVFAAALLADLANFVLVAVPMCVVLRRSVRPMLRTSWLPMLPWQVVTGAILSATVLLERSLGPAAVAIAAVSLVAAQIGCRALLERRQRGGGLPLRPEPGSRP